ncbi:UDP-glucose/GDP-mannose dehydrogenase family protein [Thalassobacillus sp. CUG 92003]|uniref:UDP-glucose dehydrogenase family protein n=1 Tax=Thalassobacillus sp. CUG 92003 TaxID=2736641 RepID=UPI0015E76726|nr:UDP-glucose/GDP-mannose dehydrogenase family protein [Thalassobacillus sp. CUG 92003]
MKISVIGTGYVGLVTGVCLTDVGHQVTCIDIDEKKIESMKKGHSPIYEPGLDELMKKNIKAGRLYFTSDYASGVKDAEVVVIAVGTPQSKDGSADLQYLEKACRSIAQSLQNDTVVVTKSTVPVGTNEYVAKVIRENVVNDVQVTVASNPEFLREGSAIYDTFNGDRIIIGAEDDETLATVARIYQGFDMTIVKTDLRSAEMIKYASNAFLATKISFINELSNVCEQLGANIENVAEGMGMDQRIGNKFLNAGVGYGGSCFPKDTQALLSIGRNVGVNMPIIQSVIETNDKQQRIIVDKIKHRFTDLTTKKIAVLGLAFKPNTDDMRDAPSIKVVRELVDAGAEVHAYDPIASENAKVYLPGATIYHDSIEEALADKDFVVIMTDWPEFKDYSIENYSRLLKQPVIFDGRNCYSLADANQADLEYHSIGRPTVNQKE